MHKSPPAILHKESAHTEPTTHAPGRPAPAGGPSTSPARSHLHPEEGKPGVQVNVNTDGRGRLRPCAQTHLVTTGPTQRWWVGNKITFLNLIAGPGASLRRTFHVTFPATTAPWEAGGGERTNLERHTSNHAHRHAWPTALPVLGPQVAEPSTSDSGRAVGRLGSRPAR